jgi:hypothetical protein
MAMHLDKSTTITTVSSSSNLFKRLKFFPDSTICSVSLSGSTRSRRDVAGDDHGDTHEMNKMMEGDDVLTGEMP